MKARALILFTLLTLGTWSSPGQAGPLGDLFKKVNPAVVVIRTEERIVTGEGQQRLTSTQGLGSGVLISEDGKVLTAAHVVQAADNVEAEFVGGETVFARVIASVPAADVALLQLERVPGGVVPVPMGDSDQVDVGDEVFVVGAPYGVGHSLTVGHISGRHAPNSLSGDLTLGEFLQTDAAINKGNSGGPMFNMKGEIVGVVSHIMSQSGGFEGLGFAVTSNKARKLLFEERSIWSGLEGKALTGEIAQVFNVPQPAGVLVERVAERSTASRLGLRGGTLPARIGDETLVVGGDIILTVQGITVTGEEPTLRRIRRAIGALEPGEQIKLTILRAGETMELSTHILE